MAACMKMDDCLLGSCTLLVEAESTSGISINLYQNTQRSIIEVIRLHEWPAVCCYKASTFAIKFIIYI